MMRPAVTAKLHPSRRLKFQAFASVDAMAASHHYPLIELQVLASFTACARLLIDLPPDYPASSHTCCCRWQNQLGNRTHVITQQRRMKRRLFHRSCPSDDDEDVQAADAGFYMQPAGAAETGEGHTLGDEDPLDFTLPLFGELEGDLSSDTSSELEVACPICSGCMTQAYMRVC